MPSTLIKATIGLAGTTAISGGTVAIYLTSKNRETKNESNKPSIAVPDKVISTLFDKAKIKALTNEQKDIELMINQKKMRVFKYLNKNVPIIFKKKF